MILYLLDEEVNLLSDLPAQIPSRIRDALQVSARQTGDTAPGKSLLYLRIVKV